MNLHHFAHKNEAQAFLASKDYKGLNSPVGKLYQSKHDTILISGPGILNALKAVVWVLSEIKEIKHVFNFGVAGALDNKIPLKTIIKIKTVYGQLTDTPEFSSHSFSGGELNCISNINKVLDDDTAKKLSFFAPIVDCELWGVAEACKLFNKPLNSYKVISDYAGSLTDCEQVIADSSIYSNELLNYFINIDKHIHSITTENETEEELPKGFYFTESLKKQFKNIIKNVSLNEDRLLKIKEKEANEKKRTLILMRELSLQDDPIKAQAIMKLENILADLNAIGAKTNFDSNLEKMGFNLSMEINSEKNIDNLKEALTKLSYSEIEATLNGHFDV